LINKETALISIASIAIGLLATPLCATPSKLMRLSEKPSTQTTLKLGTVVYSFSQSAQQLHIPQSIINDYEKIFSRKINFQHNIRPNDKFLILYQQRLNKNSATERPHILLAQFIRGNHTNNAIQFDYPHHHGFYNLAGSNQAAQFLLAPLKYKYISSKFNPHRLDPITHHIQPHNGVDFAAHSGTPIHSVGDGKVIFNGWERGYGNVVKIRYTPSIMALYAHLSRFAHLHNGEHVHKNQVIGYVGMTGWATGPHLHFGWYVHHKPIDPMTRPISHLAPVPNQYKNSFEQANQTLFITLRQLLAHCQRQQPGYQSCTQTITSA
jgi:murein DD-endopeptidase MepM/ murein hydrolase activator NlpD